MMRLDATVFAYALLTLFLLARLAVGSDPPARDGCRVTHVHDGDTVTLRCDGRAETARLIGLDTPELDGACAHERDAAQAARAALAARVRAATEVRVAFEGHDRYGRALVRLWLDGTEAAEAMLAAGHGRSYDGGRRAGWCG